MEITIKDNYGNDIKVGSVVLIGTSNSLLRKAIVKSITNGPNHLVKLRTLGYGYGDYLVSGHTHRYAYNGIIHKMMFYSNDIQSAFPEYDITLDIKVKPKPKPKINA